MDIFVTYQQDTLSLMNNIQQAPETSVLNGDKPVPIVQTREQNNNTETAKKKTYTNAEIQNWRIQQENKLKIGDSKYIAPRTSADLSYSETTSPQLVLPIRERISAGTDWLTLVIFFGIILFATVRYAYAKYMEHLYLSIFNYATSVRMLQEKNYPAFHGAFRLEAIFYITFSTFVFQTLNILSWRNSHVQPSHFLLIFGMVLLYFFGKKFLYWLSGSMFNSLPETREYLFNIDNFNRSLGLILLPTTILVSFAPARNPVFIVYSGFAIIVIFNLLLLQRGIFILLKKQFSIFYLFLYLCTLEFLPLLLIYKVVVE